MKKPSLRIIGIGIGKGEETQVKGTENIFNKITEENCPNLKDIPIKVQEAHRTLKRLEQKRKSPHHIIIKTPNIQANVRILKDAREKI